MLLGAQLAAENLIGGPRIVGEGERAQSQSCPPVGIARDEPYVLFLDELNGSSHDVQKAFTDGYCDRATVRRDQAFWCPREPS